MKQKRTVRSFYSRDSPVRYEHPKNQDPTVCAKRHSAIGARRLEENHARVRSVLRHIGWCFPPVLEPLAAFDKDGVFKWDNDLFTQLEKLSKPKQPSGPRR